MNDLAEDARWPELAAQARAEGVRSVAAVPIDVRRAAVGALSAVRGPDFKLGYRIREVIGWFGLVIVAADCGADGETRQCGVALAGGWSYPKCFDGRDGCWMGSELCVD